MADAAQQFLDEKLSKNRFTIRQQEELAASGGPSVAGSGDGVVPGGSAYDKYKTTPSDSPKLSDAEAYLDRYKDLQYWDSDSGEDGLHTGEGKWSKEIGISSEGMEKGWVGEMNKMYGTDNTDMNQFSKEQYAKAHYEIHGKKEGRTWGNVDTDTSELKSEPTPIEHSPEVKEATARVRAYEDNIMSGKTSDDLFGDYSRSTGLDLNNASANKAEDRQESGLNRGDTGIGTSTGSQPASKTATYSFLDKKKTDLRDKMNFTPAN